MASPSILHVDLDAFYVSMELLRHPELRGKPVIVGGSHGNRGIVTTCSYEARKFGVHSAMPAATAKRLCPQATWLPVDFSHYGPASKQFHAILRDYTPACESAGADEAYMDVSGSERLFGDGEAIARDLRRRVKDEIGINASVGVSTNKLVSKVASDAGKPDGLVVVPAGEEAAFFAPRPLRELPGIGPRTQERLERLGMRTIGDLAAYPADLLIDKFGDHGRDLHARARGIHHRSVHGERGAAKSVSREVTFGQDEASGDRLRAVLRSHAERISRDLARQEVAARTATLKLRFPPFETITRSYTPPAQLEFADDLYAAGTYLFDRAWDDNDRRPVRLIGLGASNLGPRARQLRLGEQIEEASRLDDTVTGLRDRFGFDAVKRAAEVGREVRRFGPRDHP